VSPRLRSLYRQTTLRSNVIVLLSDRYGWWPLPETIAARRVLRLDDAL